MNKLISHVERQGEGLFLAEELNEVQRLPYSYIGMALRRGFDCITLFRDGITWSCSEFDDVTPVTFKLSRLITPGIREAMKRVIIRDEIVSQYVHFQSSDEESDRYVIYNHANAA
jgi:hypothetical protein